MALSDTSGSLRRFADKVSLSRHKSTEAQKGEMNPPASPLCKGGGGPVAYAPGSELWVVPALRLHGFVADLVRSLALAALMAIG